MWTRDPKEGILATTRELGIGFVAYSPPARGFLSGRITSIDDLAADDTRRRHPRFLPENFARNLELVDRIVAMAAGLGLAPAQVALEWVLARERDIVPIPGTTSVARLGENISAVSVTLSNADIAELDAIFPIGITADSRYPDMSTVNG